MLMQYFAPLALAVAVVACETQESTRLSSTTASSTEVSGLASGEAHSCAILAGEVACWGRNIVGQLGIGDQETRKQPVFLSGLSDVKSLAQLLPYKAALASLRPESSTFLSHRS